MNHGINTDAGWLEHLHDLDCGWRVDRSKTLPCHYCKQPCNGRNGSGETPVCYTCYHNVGECSSAMLCGKPVGTTPESVFAEHKKEWAARAKAKAPARRLRNREASYCPTCQHYTEQERGPERGTRLCAACGETFTLVASRKAAELALPLQP